MKVRELNSVWEKAVDAKPDEEFRPCFCVGPQNGDPVCPCQMRARRSPSSDWMEGFIAGKKSKKEETK